MTLQVNSTEAENQTGKSKYSYSFAKIFHIHTLILSPHPVPAFPSAALCEEENCKKNQICEYTSSGLYNCTCAPGFYGDNCEGIVHLAGLTATAGSWAGREQTRVFEEELCYPTGIWSSALEEAAVMMDYCNYQNWHGLAQFTTGTSRLMLWIIVLQHILLVYQQEEVLCLDLKRRLYESKLVFGIQVISSDRAVEICMLPHRYLFLWNLAIAPHYSFKHSCCLHNHKAIWTQNILDHLPLMLHTFLSLMYIKSFLVPESCYICFRKQPCTL